MSSGFVYVLINPAMPGLAKVGKTTRTSNERQIELSCATGVPSPFILAYEQPVTDCHAAESWVHAELERRGYRASDSREFFTAPLHEIVSIVAMGASTEMTRPANSQSPRASKEDLADEISRIADGFRDGTGDAIRSTKRALELYEQAAKLGDSYSCEQAAIILLDGDDGVKRNVDKAIEYLKKSLSFSPSINWHLNGKIAQIYSLANQPVSALPYWVSFAEKVDDRTMSHQAAMLWRYCYDVVIVRSQHKVPDATIGLFGPLLIDQVNEALMQNRLDVSSAERIRSFIVDCVGKSW